MTAPETEPTAVQPATKPLTAREKVKLNQVPVHDPLIGTVMGGHYEIVECVGKGGMSIVYKTRHQLINQFRAVKILLPHRDNASDCLLRFQLEATAASRMDNNHIVRVHDFVAPEESAPYMVMDFVDGVALGDEIDKNGRLPVVRSLAIFVQILDAIGHTHARGVIHRDLKPDNILLVDDQVEGPDFVKLIDFGIAKLTAADKMQSQKLTPTGEIFGSPQYMSPEQCAALPMDARSEIYSLGCILYEMLSGRAPLLGKSVLETLNMQAHTPATAISKLPLDPPVVLPRGLDEIILKCLAKKPADRYANTEDLANALTKIPSFDRRKMSSRSFPVPIGAALGLVASGMVLSFCFGASVAKYVPAGPPPKHDEVALSPTAANETDQWQGLYLSGQKAVDEGDLTSASSKLEEALSKANALNDGQKRSAATGVDLESVNLIKQLKSIAPTETESLVAPSKNYPNHPWETKISALAELLQSKPNGAEEEKGIFRSAVELLEDSHQGNLDALDQVLQLANERLLSSAGISVRDKMRLALLIAGTREEQGYYQRARTVLDAQAGQLATVGEFDQLTAKYHLLDGRVALDENDLKRAQVAADKAQAIYKENIKEHAGDLAEVAWLQSDIAMANEDLATSAKLATQALTTLSSAPPSDRVQVLRDKVLMRVALIDPGDHLEAAAAQNQTDLDQQEALLPKDVPHLVTALHMSYYLDKLKGGATAAGGRHRLWRAVALAYATGRLGLTSNLMQPLMVSYDTTLTQKELLKLATNRLAIDQSLAAAGNHNGPALLEDYVVLGEALEDFSLGPARDLKKAKMYLDKATILSGAEENRSNHLIVARVYYYQARCAQERKEMPEMVSTLLLQTNKELKKITNNNIFTQEERASALELAKKVQALQTEATRPPNP